MSEKDGFAYYSSSDSCTSPTTRTVSFDSDIVTADPLPLDHSPECAPSNDPPQPLPPEQPSPEEDPSAAQLEGAYSRLTPSPKQVFPGPKTSPGPKEKTQARRSSGWCAFKGILKGFPTIREEKESQEEKESKEGLLESTSSEGSSEVPPPPTQPQQQIQEAPSVEEKGKSRRYSLPGLFMRKQEARQASPSKTSEPELRRKSEGQIERLDKVSSVDLPKKKSPIKIVIDKCMKPFGSKKGDAKDKKGTEKQSKEHEVKLDDPGLAEASTSGVQALAEESEHTEESPNAIPLRMRRQRSDSEACESPSKRKALDE